MRGFVSTAEKKFIDLTGLLVYHFLPLKIITYRRKMTMEKTDLPEITLRREPTIHPGAFIARGAQVIGDARLMAEASIWYNSVVRGDINYISIGERTNIQDGCILHLENDLPCIVHNDITVGHGAILHGCEIEEGCLIGMGAIILSGVRIKRGSVIAAGSVVKEGAVVEPFSLMAGIPAKFIRTLPEETLGKNLKWAKKYAKLAKLHRSKGLGR
jgi:carbonic anhydrase/acetyltransferase-like protein (isoleucine patch superfamily)